MNKEEYQKYWGKGLIVYTHASKNTMFPELSIRILEDWGLPTLNDWIFNFDCLKSDLRLIKFRGKEFYGFGKNYEADLAFNKDNRIWRFLRDDEDIENQFVNTSLQNFATFLCFFHEYWEKVKLLEKKNEEDKIMLLISETKNKMLKADPEALSDEEYFWSIILEEMGYGFI